MAKESSLIKTSGLVKRAILVFLTVALLTICYNFSKDYITRIQQPSTSNPNYTPYIAANNKFDKIEFPEISSSVTAAYSSTVSFTLEGTKEFAKFQKSVYIFALDEPKENFLTGDSIQKTAETLGFTDKFKEREGGIITWGNVLTRQLEFSRNKLTWNLNTNPNYRDKILVSSNNNTQIAASLKQVAQGVSRAGFDLSTFNTLEPEYYPILFKGNDKYEIDPISDFYLVNYTQSIYSIPVKPNDNQAEKYIKEQEFTDKIKVLTPDPYLGNFNFIFNKGLPKADQIAYIKYYPTQIKDDPGIYEIISPEEAYQRLQNKEGLVQKLYIDDRNKFNDIETAEIAEIKISTERTQLAYLQPYEWSGYLYPIYVFTGNAVLTGNQQAKFVIYVNALK